MGLHRTAKVISPDSTHTETEQQRPRKTAGFQETLINFRAVSARITALSALPAIATAALLAVAPTLAEDLPLRFVTADGTWDCKDEKGADTGAIVFVDEAYAFIKTDGYVAGYGKLFVSTREEFDLPQFGVIDGYLKDELHSLGIGMQGPRESQLDLRGEIFVNIIFSADDDGATDWYCTRRRAPGA